MSNNKTHVTIKAGAIGTGSYLPEKKETVEDFMKKGASKEMIDKWGIFEHRVMGKDETVTDMEIKASLRAMEKAGIGPDDIDLIISGSTIPVQPGVPNANLLQDRLGASNAAAFDVVQACSTPISQTIIASQFIALNQYRYILITASSNATRVTDFTDPASFVVLGDGAGALVMGPTEENRGIVAFDMQTQGRYYFNCGIKVKEPKNKRIREKQYYDLPSEKLLFYIEDVDDDRSDFWNYSLYSVPENVNRVLAKAGLEIPEIDFFIFHQNVQTRSSKWLEVLDIPREKTYFTYSRYGNMFTANIFVNLDEALRKNKIKRDDLVVFAGQGAGMSVGSIVMKW